MTYKHIIAAGYSKEVLAKNKEEEKKISLELKKYIQNKLTLESIDPMRFPKPLVSGAIGDREYVFSIFFGYQISKEEWTNRIIRGLRRKGFKIKIFGLEDILEK